eukprot:SAG11_NODE_1702_length_4421_cov_6.229755_3_plen_373_part_00
MPVVWRVDVVAQSLLYAVSPVPVEMQRDLLLPPWLEHGGFSRNLAMANLWMAGGGAAANGTRNKAATDGGGSVLHADDFDNLNCVLDGAKRFFLVRCTEPPRGSFVCATFSEHSALCGRCTHATATASSQRQWAGVLELQRIATAYMPPTSTLAQCRGASAVRHRILSSGSHYDICTRTLVHVNYPCTSGASGAAISTDCGHQYVLSARYLMAGSVWGGIDWWDARLQRGDCLFLPAGWYHHVRTPPPPPGSARSLAVNVWWERNDILTLPPETADDTSVLLPGTSTNSAGASCAANDTGAVQPAAQLVGSGAAAAGEVESGRLRLSECSWGLMDSRASTKLWGGALGKVDEGYEINISAKRQTFCEGQGWG